MTLKQAPACPKDDTARDSRFDNSSDAIVRLPFAAGWKNFERVYRDAVDAWVLYDNAGKEPKLIDWGERP